MSKKRSEEQAPKTGDVGFEQALERLETIVSEMESGTLPLEDMMKRFEEGRALAKLCSTKLNQVEKRIEILVKEGDEVVARPFEGERESAPDKHDEPAGNGLPF